ncbi:MAG: flagellar hook-length control protein FliK [Polyangiales bacterium]
MKAVDLISNLFAEPAAKDTPTSPDLFDALLAEANSQQAGLLPDGTLADEAALALLAGTTPSAREAAALLPDGRAVPKLGAGKLLSAHRQGAPTDPHALLAQAELVQAAPLDVSDMHAVTRAGLRDERAFALSRVDADSVRTDEALANEALLGQVAAQIAQLIAPAPALLTPGARASTTATPAATTAQGGVGTGNADTPFAQPALTTQTQPVLGAYAQTNAYAQVMQSVVSTQATQAAAAPRAVTAPQAPAAPTAPTVPQVPGLTTVTTPTVAATQGPAHEVSVPTAAQLPTQAAALAQPAAGQSQVPKAEPAATTPQAAPTLHAVATPTPADVGAQGRAAQGTTPTSPQASATSTARAGVPQATRPVATQEAAATPQTPATVPTTQPAASAPPPVVQGVPTAAKDPAAAVAASTTLPSGVAGQTPVQARDVTPRGDATAPAPVATPQSAPVTTQGAAASSAQREVVPTPPAAQPALAQPTTAEPMTTQPAAAQTVPPQTVPAAPTQVSVQTTEQTTEQTPSVMTPRASTRLQTHAELASAGLQTTQAPQVPPPASTPGGAQLGVQQASEASASASVRGRSLKGQLRDADAAQLGTSADALPAVPAAPVTPVAPAEPVATSASALRAARPKDEREGPTFAPLAATQPDAASAAALGLTARGEGRVAPGTGQGAARRVTQGTVAQVPATTFGVAQPVVAAPSSEARASEAALLQQAGAQPVATPVAHVPTQVLPPPAPLAPPPPAQPVGTQAREGGMIEAAQQHVAESELASHARGERASKVSDEPLDRLSAFTRGAAIGSAISAYGGRGHAGSEHRGTRNGREEGERDERDVVQTSHALEATARAFEQASVQLQQPPSDPQPTSPAARPPVPMSSPVPLPELPDVELGRVPVQPENASISLHHPDLGPIQLQVHRNQGRVEVHAVIESAHAEAVLRANESGIRYGVQQSGMTLGALRVRMRDSDERELPSTTRGPLMKKRRVTSERQA